MPKYTVSLLVEQTRWHSAPAESIRAITQHAALDCRVPLPFDLPCPARPWSLRSSICLDSNQGRISRTLSTCLLVEKQAWPGCEAVSATEAIAAMRRKPQLKHAVAALPDGAWDLAAYMEVEPPKQRITVTRDPRTAEASGTVIFATGKALTDIWVNGQLLVALEHSPTHPVFIEPEDCSYGPTLWVGPYCIGLVDLFYFYHDPDDPDKTAQLDPERPEWQDESSDFVQLCLYQPQEDDTLATVQWHSRHTVLSIDRPVTWKDSPDRITVTYRAADPLEDSMPCRNEARSKLLHRPSSKRAKSPTGQPDELPWARLLLYAPGEQNPVGTVSWHDTHTVLSLHASSCVGRDLTSAGIDVWRPVLPGGARTSSA